MRYRLLYLIRIHLVHPIVQSVVAFTILTVRDPGIHRSKNQYIGTYIGVLAGRSAPVGISQLNIHIEYSEDGPGQ